MSSKTMAAVIERHHMSHSDWDENQFAILCHCGTEVVGEDNGEEAYVQEEALYAGHLAEVLATAGFGDVRAVADRVGKRYSELHQMLRDELRAKALEDAADDYRHYETPNARVYLRARAAAVRGEG